MGVRLTSRMLLVAVIALALAAGAGAAAAADEPDELRKRATAYWDAKIAQSAEVYEFYAPAEKGGPADGSEVPEGGNLTYKAYEIEEVRVEGDEGFVRLRIETSFPGAQRLRLPDHILKPTGTERWHRVDGTWFRRGHYVGLSGSDEGGTPPEVEVSEVEAEAAPAPESSEDTEAAAR